MVEENFVISSSSCWVVLLGTLIAELSQLIEQDFLLVTAQVKFEWLSYRSCGWSDCWST